MVLRSSCRLNLDDLRYGVDVGFRGGGDDVGIGGVAVEELAVVLDLDVHDAVVFSAAGDGLHQHLLEVDAAVYQRADSSESCVHRAFAAACGAALLAVDDQTHGSHGDRILTADNLQIIKLYLLDYIVLADAGNGIQVIVVNLFLAVGKVKEFLVCVGKLFGAEHDAQPAQMVVQSCTAAASGEGDGRIIDTDVLRVDDLVALAVLQHAVLMDA